MISFRYHLVTIVAVFLALGLGLLAGTTVVDENLVQRLKDQTHSANALADQRQTIIDQLNGRSSRAQQLASDLVPPLEQGRLAGTDVVVVSDKNTDPAVLDQSSQSLKQAGAHMVTTLTVTPKFASSDPAVRAELAKILGIDPSTPAGTLSHEAAAALANRIAIGAPSSAGVKADGDLLLQLLNGGFLVSSPTVNASEIPSIGGPGQPVVVLSGGESAPAVPPGAFLVPFTESLAKQSFPVVAGEGSNATTDFVTSLRSDGIADGKQMVTVDNLDEPVGGLALVLGLSDYLSTEQGGNFGFKRGADQLYPPLSP